MAKLTIKNRYGVVPNSILNCDGLSFKAKGLYAYIQSKPDDRQFSTERIVSDTKDGLDSIVSGIRELEAVGCLTREKSRDDKGHWQMEYVLHDSTTPTNPVLENPLPANPVQAIPVQAKPVYNKERITKKELTKKDIQTSTIVEEASPVFGDPDVNDIIALIKLHNNGICDGSIKQQRMFAKHLHGTLSKLDTVANGKNTAVQVLGTILEIVSKNKYHSHKISSPEKIYRSLAELMNICRQEYTQAKAKETPSFSM